MYDHLSNCPNFVPLSLRDCTAVCELRFRLRVHHDPVGFPMPYPCVFSHNRVFGLHCSSSLLVIIIALVVDHVEESQFVDTFAGGHHP
jgi:hypothetical protein